MALTRKLLKGMGLTEEQVDTIIESHTETVNGLKEQITTIEEERDSFKADAEKLPKVQKKYDDLKATVDAGSGEENPFEKQYNDLKAEYDKYKEDIETEKTTAAKKEAYRKLLIEAKIPEKRFDAILKVTNIEDIKLDKDGNIKDADDITKNIKEEWSDFIQQESTKGANTPTPPTGDAGGDGGKPSRASELVSKFYADRYGTKKEE